SAKTYFIKDGYVHRSVNVTLEAEPAAYWNRLRIHTGSYFQQAVYRYAAALVERRSLSSVLDVGCGVGHKLARHIRPVADRVVGIDQPTCIEVARRKYRDLEFASADLDEAVESGLGTFDLIIAADVIEHLAEPDALLRLLDVHSHPDTWVVLSTPERDVLRGEENLQSPKREHLREWNHDELLAYLVASGFRVVEHRLVPAYRIGLSPVMWMYRIRDYLQRVPLAHCQMVTCRKDDRGATAEPDPNATNQSTSTPDDQVPEKREPKQEDRDQ
ncbi:MAG TPA: class I SAM-dependent methyltransferase, partial [Acidimicrobiia bacterium]